MLERDWFGRKILGPPISRKAAKEMVQTFKLEKAMMAQFGLFTNMSSSVPQKMVQKVSASRYYKDIQIYYVKFSGIL